MLSNSKIINLKYLVNCLKYDIGLMSNLRLIYVTIKMAAFFFIDDDDQPIMRKERVFRDRSNALEVLDDKELISRYRFDRQGIIDLIDCLKPHIEHPTNRGHAIPASIQVLTTLRYLAKGDFYSEASDIHGISKSSTCRIIHRVCNAIHENINLINMPRAEDCVNIKRHFYHIANFPNVVGCVDGTLIPIQKPPGDDGSFYCRKGYTAINVQAVTDHQLKFIDVTIRWPGSSHDSFVLANSAVPDLMKRYQNSWLLGDSGYPLRDWLMTPVLKPSTQSEERYNRAHCATRCTVERAFGLLKSRFRCLHKSGGCLPFIPEKCVKVINACFQLHNMAVDRHLPVIDPVEEPLATSNFFPISQNEDETRNAKELRRRLILRF